MRISRVNRRFGGLLAKTRSFGSRVPSWIKPSRVTAYTGAAVGVFQLAFTPIFNGQTYDSWHNRVVSGIGQWKQTGDFSRILGSDPVGNDALTIAALQLKQNAWPAIGTMAGFGVASAIEAFFGL